jgi:pseudouridine-5'-phosphate glycosidase
MLDVLFTLIAIFSIALLLHACCPHCQVLDIPRTLEYLETQGVCVVAYGADEFPAFFSRHSGCKAPCRVDDPQQ